ncbi:MAG TPA: polysaccharide deacetylase family protein [Hanamia sp.]|nr:polysaccharide deacetylase family protein [Hanamia sp.]
MLYLKKTPWIFKRLFPERVWKIKTNEKVLFLTFDDGPHPEATAFVLDQLKKYNAKATFFCIGKNVKEHFPIYERIINEGHKAGNHTFRHLNGWKTDDKKYIDDIAEAAKLIDSNLFRPPYGRITKFQAKVIAGGKFHLKIIMWDVLSGDFDPEVNGENCYLNVINNAKPGSIVVFHDSAKAFPVLQYALPQILEYYSKNKYAFEALPSEYLAKKIGPE